MESKVLAINPQQSVPPMAVVVGSSRHFNGVPEPGDNYSRPLMINAWSQTTGSDFTYVAELEQQDQQSQREKELEEKIKVLEENLKAHTDLLSQIHATSARTSALLGQQLTYPSPSPSQENEQKHAINSNNLNYNGRAQVTYTSQENEQKNTTNSNNLNYNGRAQQSSPRNAISQKASPINSVINPLQQVNCSPADSIKYTIIAEGSGHHNGEPIEIHLAEDDGAINLNNSTDSGRLEICLAPEENVDIKTEQNGDNIKTIEQSSPNEHHFIKKRKLTVDQSEMLSINSNYLLNNQENLPSTSGQSLHKRRSSSSILKTPKIEHNSSKNANDVHIPTISMQDSMSSSHNILSVGEHINIGTENVMISLGPNNTRIPAKVYETISWASASIATRKLLMTIFDRKTLATHSMTGKPSPAFKDHGKPLKQMLDPLIIADIIFTVTRKCKVSDKEVRNAITTKCADENKMMKLQMNKRIPMKEINKENVDTKLNP